MDTEGIELTTHYDAEPSALTAAEGTAPYRQHLEREADEVTNRNSYPPADEGFAAWSFLVAAFVGDVLLWGFPSSWGILLSIYLNDPVYSSQKHAGSLLPLVGTLCTGIMYCSGLVINPLINRYPNLRRYLTWAGTLICVCSLLLASFTTKVTTLVALQGILYAIGGSLAYAPIVSYLSEWFVRRRGLANGVVFSGAGAAGILFPLIFPPLIERFGTTKTIRGYAITMLIGMVFALLSLKPRLPAPRARGPHPRSRNTYNWLRDRNLWFFVVINTVQGLGYFVPLTWLLTYASSLGLSPTKSSLSLAVFNATAYVACFVVGFMSDRYDVWILALTSLVLTSSATFVLWGVLSYSLAGVLIYSSVYGAVAGGFSSLWSAFTKPIAKDDTSLTTTIFGFMLLTRGIGNILSTPISTALQQMHENSSQTHKTGFSVADGKYQDMIIFSGTCFAGAALIALVGWGVDRRYRSNQ